MNCSKAAMPNSGRWAVFFSAKRYGDCEEKMASDRGCDFHSGVYSRHGLVDLHDGEIPLRGVHTVQRKNRMPQRRRRDPAGSAAHRYRSGVFGPGGRRFFQLQKRGTIQGGMEAVNACFSVSYNTGSRYRDMMWAESANKRAGVVVYSV